MFISCINYEIVNLVFTTLKKKNKILSKFYVSMALRAGRDTCPNIFNT